MREKKELFASSKGGCGGEKNKIINPLSKERKFRGKWEKKTTHSKREKSWKQNQQENKISTQIVKEKKLWDGKIKTNHYERKGCFIISLATQFWVVLDTYNSPYLYAVNAN